MRQVGDRDEFQEQAFDFEVSDEKMSYTDALGYCFLKDMRLLDFDVDDPEAVRQMVRFKKKNSLTVSLPR